MLEPGLNLIIPFLDRVAYRHSLKEVPLDVPEQVCITKDNTQLAVDGILYYQVTDPRLASYGSSNYVAAISQLAQTTLRSEIGKMELDKSFESRDEINRQIVAVLDEAGRNWGIKVLRYEIKSLTPPEIDPARDAGADHRRAREARADRQVRGRAPAGDQHRRRREAGGDPRVRGREAGARSTSAQGEAHGDPRHRRGERRRRCARWPRRSPTRAAWRRPTSRSRSSTSTPSAMLAKTSNTLIIPVERRRHRGLRRHRDDGARQDQAGASRRERSLT